MKKIIKILVGLLIVVGIILAAPFGMGFIVEKEFKKVINEAFNFADPSKTQNTAVEITSYKRGWFSSKAKVTLTIQNLEINGQKIKPIQFFFDDEIKHGPIIAAKDGSGKMRFLLGRALTKVDLEKTSNLNLKPLPMNLGVIGIDLSGGVQVHADIKQAKLDFPTITLEIKNLYNQVALSRDRQELETHFTLESGAIKAKDRPQQLSLNNLKSAANVAKSSQGLWLGDKEIELEKMIFSKEKEQISVQGISNKSQSSEQDNKVKTALDLSVKSVSHNEETYGPHKLSFQIDGLDANILTQINQTFAQLNQNRAQQKMTEAAEEKQEQETTQKLTSLLLDLIKHGLNANIKKLEVVTPWGPFNANAQLKLPASNGQKGMASLSWLSSVLNMDAGINAQFSKKLILVLLENRFDEMLRTRSLETTGEARNFLGTGIPEKLAQKHLEKLLSEGWLIPESDGDLYKIKLSFQKGTFLVNEKALKPHTVLPSLEVMPEVSEEMTEEVTVTSETPEAQENTETDSKKEEAGEAKKPEGIEQKTNEEENNKKSEPSQTLVSNNTEASSNKDLVKDSKPEIQTDKPSISEEEGAIEEVLVNEPMPNAPSQIEGADAASAGTADPSL